MGMPMMEHLAGLVKTAPLLASLLAESGQEDRRRKNTLHRARTARNDVRVKHHLGQTMAFIARMLVMESNGRPLLILE
jgi:hypothetical protein